MRGSDLAITNDGTIAGALTGSTRANAVTFTGGVNSLTITPNSVILGNVVAFSSADTFGLGGTTSNGATFDLTDLGAAGSSAQYQGFGILRKQDTSTWSLQGTPGTTLAYQILNGTLDLEGATQAASSLLLVDGTLRNGTLTVAGAIEVQSGLILANLAGTGSLTKTTAGIVTLSGVNTYMGATAVNAGTLNVTGSATSSFTVNGGGTLTGVGTVGALAVASGGTVIPGLPLLPAPRSLSVTGDVSFASGSTFRVYVTPTDASRIDAGGVGTLGGGTVDVRAGIGTYTPTTRYTLLKAAAGLTGKFDTLTTTTNLAFLRPTLSYDANTVLLGFDQATTTVTTTDPGAVTPSNPTGTVVVTTPVAFASVATTPNQTATANAVQSLPSTNPVYAAVLSQSVAGARQAFESLSGESHSSGVTQQFETAFMVENAVMDRVRGFTSGGLGLGFADATVPAAFAADLPGGRQPEVAAVPFTVLDPRVFSLWGQGFGSFGSTRANGNAATLTRDTGGFVIGGDATLDRTYRIGVAGGFTDTNLDVRARGSRGEVTSGFGAIYGGASFGAVNIRLGGSFAGDSTRTTRNVSFPGFSNSLSAKFGGSTLQGFGEVGYRFGFGMAAVEPFVGGAGIRISRDRFTETGGVAALTVASRDYDTQTLTLGVRGEMALAEGSPVSLKGLIGYRRAFGDVTPVSLLAFAAGGSQFSTAGTPIDRNAVIAEAGVDWRVTRDLTLSLSYAGQVGNRAQDHGVKGGILYRF